jgi:uncharacterized protein YdeI (YjbR/CyaY-like superfamily)
VDITETIEPRNRAEWRGWLDANCSVKQEIWLVSVKGQQGISYVDSVLEGLCFGWIDGIKKRLDDQRTGQRFTPRRPKGNWTELNKERARGLIAEGLMTSAGLAVLPDLTVVDLVLADDIAQALRAEKHARENFERFPDLYKRIRIAHIEESRKQADEFEKRLAKFVQQTALNKMFGGAEATAS